MTAPVRRTGLIEEVELAKFKRKRPKNRRAGCLLCKPHKVNGAPPGSNLRVSELGQLDGRLRRRTRHGIDDTMD